MLKKAFSKVLLMSCVVAILKTTPATTLLADDFQEYIIINDIHDDS